jgi:hypothetical protein
VFTTSKPALRFHATNRIDALQSRPADGSHRRRLLPPMHERIEEIPDHEQDATTLKSVFLTGLAQRNCSIVRGKVLVISLESASYPLDARRRRARCVLL